MALTINETRCLGCGTCVADCVCGILELHDGVPAFKPGKSHICVHCGHCSAICPVDALTLDGRASEEQPLAAASVCGAPAMAALLKGRRAMRQFAPHPVPPMLLEEAIAFANYAPTAHNAREVAYTVLNGRPHVEALLAGLVELLERQGMYPGHVANVRQGRDTLFRGAPCLVLLHAPERILSESDCATAAAYLELALHGLGLGSCWAGMLIEACVHELPEGLSLPASHKLYAALMVGRPIVAYHRIPYRAPARIHWHPAEPPRAERDHG